MGNVIGVVILGVVAIVCFAVSYFQFKQKGYLFNNVYICLKTGQRKDE